MAVAPPELAVGDPAEVHDFVELLEEAGRWLIEVKQLAQWVPGTLRKQRPGIEAMVREGALLVARRGGVLCGGCVVTPERYAAWAEVDGDAVYLHKLVTARQEAGRGLGARLLSEAEIWSRERGFASLRLDCWDGNEALIDFYTGLGFVQRGVAKEEGWCVRLLERRF